MVFRWAFVTSVERGAKQQEEYKFLYRVGIEPGCVDIQKVD